MMFKALARKMRDDLITEATDLLDGSPATDEYVRGMTDLIVRSTYYGPMDGDPDLVRLEVRAALAEVWERRRG